VAVPVVKIIAGAFLPGSLFLRNGGGRD
jgi:hypothetical protein